MLRQSAARLLRAQDQAAVCLTRLSTRSFAEQAAPSDAEKYAPPVPVHGTAGRYAAALYMAGAKANKLDQVDKDVEQVSNIVEGHDQLRRILKDPSIPRGEKQQALNAILDKVGSGDITKNFFALLVDNNRLADYMKISTTFSELVAAARGEIVATVTTAQELPQQELSEIKSGLNELMEKGQKLLVQEQVDPAIIGGIVIDIGDKHIDLSISSRIKKIQQMVLQNV